jgi:hypothetical protein
VIGWLLAAQIAIVAQGPESAVACAPVEISVAARAPGGVAPRVSFPASSAFQLLRRTMSTRQETDPAGHPYAITEGTLLVATRSTGRVVVPSIVATVGAHAASSAPFAFDVQPADEDTDEPQVLVRATLDDGHSHGDIDTLYVGQQVDYVVDVQLNDAARHRLRRNPTFFPPDMPSVLAYDVAPPPPVARDGRHCFENLTYRRALFPLFPGRLVIPPAALSYALPVSPSFFSREETHELHTDSVRVVAIDPPLAGRPSDFAGAVGAVRATSRLGFPSGRMGDPLVFTLRLEGVGNVKLLPRPAFDVGWAAVAPSEERVEVDTTHSRVSGAKEFDWLLTPRQAGHEEIPAIRYPYFDPGRATYDVAITPPIGLDVASASLAQADTALTPRLAIRTVLHEERSAPAPDRPLYWVLLALAPVPATLRRVRRVTRRRASGVTAAARLERAATAPLLARDLRRLYLDAIRERVPSLQPATARSPLARQLRRAGVTDATAAAAEALLETLDSAAFSGGGMLGTTPAADALRVTREIDAQAVRPVASRSLAPLTALVALALAGAAFALPTGVTGTFEGGVRAYQAGDFALAQRRFARVASLAPRAADGWANLGASAWARNDSAHAAAAWQRALRLEPLDVETRDRLDEVHPIGTVGEQGYVPPAPVDALAYAALALWLAAWLAMAIPPARRPDMIRPLAGGAIVVAIVALGSALELRDRLEPRGLAVLGRPVTLFESPLPNASASGTASIGEVGRVGARAGAWVRVSLDGERAGWIATSALLPLDDAASN